MKTQPVPPERVMICAAEHPSGETIFVCRGMPGRFQVTPATPEEMAWIEENLDQFRDFTYLHGQAEDLRKQLGELGAILQKTEQARAELAAENDALKAAAQAPASASEPPAVPEEAPEPEVQARIAPADAVSPAQPPAEEPPAPTPAEPPKPAEEPQPAPKPKAKRRAPAKRKAPAATKPGTKPSLK